MKEEELTITGQGMEFAGFVVYCNEKERKPGDFLFKCCEGCKHNPIHDTSMPKHKKQREIKAWAVCETMPVRGFELSRVGEETHWRYPIFPTRKDAEIFARQSHGVSYIVPCKIILK